MPLSAAEKGFKRICTSCGTRFYDLCKSPILCPKCETEFTGDIKIKTRRSRISVVEAETEPADLPEEKAAVIGESEDVGEAAEGDEELVSLEALEEDEAKEEGDELGEELGDFDEALEEVLEEDIEDVEEEIEVEIDR